MFSFSMLLLRVVFEKSFSQEEQKLEYLDFEGVFFMAFW